MAEDWDLYAIVRSCSAVKNNSSSSNINSATGGSNANNGYSNSTNTSGFENNPLECLGSLTFEDDDDLFAFPDLVLPRPSGFQELLDSYKPFLSAPPPPSVNIIIPATGAQDDNFMVASNPVASSGSSMSTGFLGFISGQNHQQQLVQQQQHQPPTTNMGVISPIFSDTHHHHHQQQQHVQQQQQFNPQIQVHQQAAAGAGQRLVVGTKSTGASTSALPLRPMQPPGSRSRKKKSSQKRLVLHVTVENLSNDVWAWRKYGQKPIKGSPYPRNYYRCSSTKGCAARKQVERSNTDPNIFIVSYSGEHNHPRPTHRNSLAGTTRNKFPANQKPDKNEAEANSVSATPQSPTTPRSSPADHETSAAGGVGGGSDHMDEGQDIMMGSDDDGEGGDDCDMDDVDPGGDDGGGDDDDDDDDDGLLIPNMSMMNDEDLIKDLRDLGSPIGGGGGHGRGRKASGRIFPSWTFGGSAAAGSS